MNLNLYSVSFALPGFDMSWLKFGVPLLVMLLLLGLMAVFIIFLPKNKGMATRELTMAAACIAASFALSFVAVTPVAYGGSITLAAIVPLVLFAYTYGIPKGLFAAFAYSLLQFMQSPHFINFFQFALDYLLPFSAFGCVAMLKKLQKPLKSYDLIVSLTIIYIFRYFCHVLSGVLYWSVSWPESFVYSIMYVPGDFAIAAVTCVALIATKALPRLIAMVAGKRYVKEGDTEEITGTGIIAPETGNPETPAPESKV